MNEFASQILSTYISKGVPIGKNWPKEYSKVFKEIFEKDLESVNVDAIISASPYIIDQALEHTNLEVHLSTQQSAYNSDTVNYWYDKGVKRVVLAREL
mgnify:CR=1 FL=1